MSSGTQKVSWTQLRRQAIVDIINNHRIKSQEEILQRISCMESIDVSPPNQSTISRDFKKLNITRDINGYYVLANEDKTQEYRRKLSFALKDNDTEIYTSVVTFALKTVPGFGRSIGVMIERVFTEKIIGTIAGEDTVIITVKDEAMVREIVNEINRMKGKYMKT